MNISIDMPDINEQRLILLRHGAEEGRDLLKKNLSAPHYGSAPGFDASAYDDKHLRTEDEGWQPPAPEIICAWFDHFQHVFPAYDSDAKLAALLGLKGKQADRRIRAFRKGETEIPYGIWRRFLIITGRASQEIIPVLGIFDIDK